MTEEQALIRSVIADVYSDVPRLVYADWLDENGKGEKCPICLQSTDCKTCTTCQGSGIVPSGYALYIRKAIEESRRPEGEYCNRFYDYQSCGCIHCRVAKLAQKYEPNIEGVRKSIARRGFVDEISCTLAELLMVQQCDECYGAGEVLQHPENMPFSQSSPSIETCVDCNGTGTLPGLARSMFGTHPITRVTLTDRHPWDATRLASNQIGDRVVWRWLLKRPDQDNRSDQIPIEIYSEMIGMESRESLSYLEFESLDAAMNALSLGCVNYARSLHGFDPLPIVPRGTAV